MLLYTLLFLQWEIDKCVFNLSTIEFKHVYLLLQKLRSVNLKKNLTEMLTMAERKRVLKEIEHFLYVCAELRVMSRATLCIPPHNRSQRV